MQNQQIKGYACILLSIFIWAGWMVASRYAVKGSLTAYDITAIRFTVAGLILLPIAIKRGFRIGPYGILGGIILSIGVGAPYTNLAVLGMKYAPASHASTFINGTLLITTTVVGILALKEPTTRLRLIGVGCSFVGVICMFFAKSAHGSEDAWIGHVLFIVSGLMWSSYTLLVRAWRADALQAAAAVCVLSMIGYMPFYLALAESHITLEHWKEVAFQGMYQGVLTAVIALISFNAGIRILGASRAGAFIPLVPVLATLLAIPILGEVPNEREVLGVACVSLGVLLASGLFRRRVARTS